MRTDDKAVAFFYAHAGYSYGKDETREQGRQRCAQQLADAEAARVNAGAYCVWQDDDSGEQSENGGPLYGCVLHAGDGRALGSLWAIDDDTNPYRRVVEAELALEHADELTTNDDA